MNENAEYCQYYLDTHICELDESSILSLSKYDNSGRTGNVIRGLHTECYGLIYYDPLTEFQMFYVTNNKFVRKMEGLSIDIPLFSKYRNLLVFLFSHVLIERYHILGADEFSIANTYQDYLRTVCEEDGFMTFDRMALQNEYGMSSISLICKQFPIDVTHFERKDFLNHCFGKICMTPDSSDIKNRENKVYVMFHKRTKLYKIGRSINPKIRERTLQVEDPGLELLVYWTAPVSVEKELHRLFKKKRIRGEWFSLDMHDLRMLSDYMKQY